MALGDGIRLLLERLRGTCLCSAANDALSQELALVQTQLRAQQDALQRLRDVQDAINYVESGQSEQVSCQDGTVDALVKSVISIDAAMAATVASLVNFEGKREDDVAEMEVSTTPQISREAHHAGKASGASHYAIAHHVASHSRSCESPPSEIVNATAADASALPATSTPRSNSHKTPTTIDTTTVRSFARTLMARCQQIHASNAPTEAELTKLFGLIQQCIPEVESFEGSCEGMAHTIASINLAVDKVLNGQFSVLVLVRVANPLRETLLASKRSELATLSDSVDTKLVSCILPPSFRPLLTTPQCARLTWSALVQLEMCDHHRSYDAKNMPRWLDFLEKKLSPSRIRMHRQAAAPTTQKTITPLPFVFLTLAIVIHVAMKLAPLDQVWDLTETLSKIKDKHEGDDNLIEIYQHKLSASCKRRATRGDSDREKLFDFEKETKLIVEKLAWYFDPSRRFRGATKVSV